MAQLTLIVLLAGLPVAESPLLSAGEIVNWDDYAPCGLVSLYLACRMKEKDVRWEELKQFVGPPGAEGELTFANLAKAASQLGMNPVGLEADCRSLQDLPMPAIIQVQDGRFPDELPHFLVLLRREADGAWLLDAPYAAYFLPEDRFQQSWTGKILIFARSEQEARNIRDLTYGSKWPQWLGWGLVVGAGMLLFLVGIVGWRPKLAAFPSAVIPRRALHWRFVQVVLRTPLLISSLSLLLAIGLSLILFLLMFQHDKDVPPRCDFGK